MKLVRMLCGIAVFLAGGAMQAQSPWQVGFAAGAAMSNLVGDGTDGLETRTTLYLGAPIVWQPISVVGFETGLYYVPKGASLEEGTDEARVKLNYVEVPLLLRLALAPSGSGIRPVLTVGPVLALKSACEVEAEGGGISIEIDCDEFFELISEDFDVNAETQSIDLGVTAGAAVDIPLGERLILAPSLRYTRGLRDVLEIDGDSVEGKNSTFQFGMALRLRL